MRLALIGSPVSHSRSPEIYRHLLGTKVSYALCDLTQAEWPEWLRQESVQKAEISKLDGFNVTHPLKEIVGASVKKQDALAKKIGAINTVAYTSRGAKGWNTDYLGELAIAQEWGWKGKGASACVVGAGGAARAMVFALARLGFQEIYVLHRGVKRSKKRAQDLVQAMNQAYARTSVTALTLSQLRARGKIPAIWLWINATPVEFKLPREVNPHAWVQDLRYASEPTELVRVATQRGLRVVDGLDLLCWQALANVQIWKTGRPPSRARLAQQVSQKRALKNKLLQSSRERAARGGARG